MASTNQGGKQGAANLGGLPGNQQGLWKRGFVSLDPERQREVASEDGKAAEDRKAVRNGSGGSTGSATGGSEASNGSR